MATRSRPCPECGSQLEPGYRNELATWECPQRHGVGVFLLEAWGTLQRDELENLMERSRDARASSLRSPLTGQPMVEVTFPVDSDMLDAQSAEAFELTIEMDRENSFGWFSIEELDAMPIDVDRRGPKSPGLVGMDQMDHHGMTDEGAFVNLNADDYDEPVTSAGFLSGLAERLRKR